MWDRYQLMRDLINLVEKFETDLPRELAEPPALKDFLNWLQRSHAGTHKALPFSYGEEDHKADLEDEIIILLVFAYRYIRGYIKKAIEGSECQTMDDFAYLISLWGQGDMSKTELIEFHIHEKASGMEVIKRLLQRDLIEQRNNMQDKRSKLLSITSKGNEEIMKLLPTMGKITQLGMGNLDEQERKTLFYLLDKLHVFHNPIFIHDKEKPLNQILKMYVRDLPNTLNEGNLSLE